MRREVCRPQEKPFARAPAVQCRADRHWLVLEFVRKQHLNNNFTTPVCWGSVLEVDGGGPRSERTLQQKEEETWREPRPVQGNRASPGTYGAFAVQPAACDVRWRVQRARNPVDCATARARNQGAAKVP